MEREELAICVLCICTIVAALVAFLLVITAIFVLSKRRVLSFSAFVILVFDCEFCALITTTVSVYDF